MNPAQLITELEKPRKNYPQGVLTWEVGDVADYNGLSCSVFFVASGTLGGHDWQAYAKDCTHSADDPRLLGRCLRELEKRHVDILIAPNGTLIIDTKFDEPEFEGDTLLEAALKALLAKVEGEQS